MMSAAPCLLLRSVTKTYASGRDCVQVLSGVDLEVHESEVVRVTGPSGSGKTTLINVAGLLTAPSSGHVVLGGVDMTAATDVERSGYRSSHIGMVFQANNLFPELDVVENVLVAAAGQQPRADVMDVLERAGLGHRLSTRAKRLSGGEQQRVAVVRALVKRPALLLADEPVSGLDDDNAAFVLDEFAKAAANGSAVIISSHDDAVDRIATRSMTMRQGQLT